MILAAAQTIPGQCDLFKNLDDHCRLAKLAANYGAQLILFPELSLTGYIREEAENFEFLPNDSRLSELKKVAADNQIIIVAGAPIRLPTGLHIGAFILFPDLSEAIYTKQFLHDGEEIFFGPGSADALQIRLEDESMSLAICADITNPAHAIKAASLNSTIYLASLFYTPNGINEGYQDLQRYARELSMSVLMSNYGGVSYGMEAAGLSGFLDNRGNLVKNFEGTGEGLVLITKKGADWEGEIVKTS